MGSIERLDPALDALVADAAEIEKIATADGFKMDIRGNMFTTAPGCLGVCT